MLSLWFQVADYTLKHSGSRLYINNELYLFLDSILKFPCPALQRLQTKNFTQSKLEIYVV